MTSIIAVKVFSHKGPILLKNIVTEIQASFRIVRVSSIYRMEGERRNPQHIHDLKRISNYEGMCLAVRTESSEPPEAVMQTLRAIEHNFRSEILHRSASLNYLVCDDITTMSPRLTLPYPEFHRFGEYLIPAAEIWGDFVHPVLKKSLLVLKSELPSSEGIEFYAQGKTLLDF